MKDVVDFLKGFDWHTVITVGVAFWWLHSDIQELKKDVSTIKTVLVVKGIMPECFAKEMNPVEKNKEAH